MILCLHDWKQIEKPKYAYTDYSGFRVAIAMCECTKCGKRKRRKFI